MRVILVRALPPNSTVLPMLSWQFVVIQMGGSGKVVDPVLVYAKENSINFFQVIYFYFFFFWKQGEG